MAIELSAAPRAKSAETTKQAILEAAQKRFLQESYENVGLRDIAGDVGVDVALISRYFGSKEGLFSQVLHDSSKEEILPEDIRSQDMPRYLTDLFLSQDKDGNENVERLLIILRSASSPAASKVVSKAMRNDILVPFAERLGGNNSEMRASTSMAVWMGMTIMRTVIAVDGMCGQTPEIEAKLQALFETALAETP